MPKRRMPRTEAELRTQQRELLAALSARIGFRRAVGPLRAQSLGMLHPRGIEVERILFESEPGMPIPSLLFIPDAPRPGAPVVVHASEDGKPKLLDPPTLPIVLARKGVRVLSIDARDTGEGGLSETPSFPPRRGGKLCAYDPHLWRREILAIRALALGSSRSAMRTLDIIRAGDLLEERGLLGSGYVVVGEGQLGVCALKAAAFDPRIIAVATVRMLASYRMITDNPYYNQFQYFWTPGVLKDYDIPDLPALVAPRPVAFIAPIDHMGRPAEKEDLIHRLAYARAAYAAAGAPDALSIVPARSIASICARLFERMIEANSDYPRR